MVGVSEIPDTAEGSPCLNLPVLPIERSEEDSAQPNRWELRAVPSGGTPTEQSVRFRVGDMPALAEGFSDRPDTARGILDALIPGSTIALVPGSEFAEGKQNWLGASGQDPDRGDARGNAVAIRRRRRGGLDLRHQPVGGALGVRRGMGGGHRHRADRHRRIGRGPLRQLARRNRSAVAGRAGRPAQRGRAGRALARRPGGPAPDHQRAVDRRGQPVPDAGLPGRLLQRPRGPRLPDRTAQREPGSAPGCHRPHRGARP